MQLPAGRRTVCGCVAVREEHGPDWLDFYLPLGALARTEPRISDGFPFDDDSGEPSLTWRHPLDEWLATIASTIHKKIDGNPPAERWAGYLMLSDGILRYTPANK
ncbi:hypothetical protein [Actinocorallia longicatena]|uniref:Uncharacterized protein n=1 Tax=Actinocorallia longicatena TaxID=111803 RepID=A0ABP6QD71_9ACTN